MNEAETAPLVGDRVPRPAPNAGTTIVGDEAPLERVGPYQLVRKLGEGGMGVVYLARHADLGKLFAIKFLSPSLTGSEKAVGKFVDEARKAARLDHPSIVQVVDLHRESGRTYIVSEYVDGPTLSHVIAHESAAGAGAAAMREWIRRSAEVSAAIADALDCAHRAGIVHCDVKPSNILMDPLRGPRLADFGIARYLAADGAGTSTSAALTPWYASPEQASISGVKIDQRSDVFSLGVVLFEMVTLRRPFEGESIAAVLVAVKQFDPPRLRSINRLIPRDLETICLKALEKHPAQRYQSAAHMAADLRSMLKGDPILATPPPIRRRIGRWIARRRVPVAISAACLLALIVAGLVLVMRARSNAAFCWLTIDPRSRPCTLILQPFDPGTLLLQDPEGARVLRGGQRLGLDPGQYRLTLVATPGATPGLFTELDLLLLSPGLHEASRLLVIGPEDEFPADHGLIVARLASPPATAEADGAGAMALVGEGSYDCGNDPGDPIVQRRQVVPIRAFLIDRVETSNREYLEFLYRTAPDAQVRQRLDCLVAGVDLDVPGASRDAHHHASTPDYWKTRGYDPALADRPVVGIRSRDAAAYARWKGKRLPTAFEWEAAARGTAALQGGERPDAPPGVVWPTFGGLSVDPAYLRLDQARDSATRLRIYAELSVAVNAPDPFQTDSGIRWMFGNAREMTSTVDLASLDGVAKGRCWLDEPRFAPLGVAWTFPLEERYFDRGFRCARSVSPVPAP